MHTKGVKKLVCNRFFVFLKGDSLFFMTICNRFLGVLIFNKIFFFFGWPLYMSNSWLHHWLCSGHPTGWGVSPSIGLCWSGHNLKRAMPWDTRNTRIFNYGSLSLDLMCNCRAVIAAPFVMYCRNNGYCIIASCFRNCLFHVLGCIMGAFLLLRYTKKKITEHSVHSWW